MPSECTASSNPEISLKNKQRAKNPKNNDDEVDIYTVKQQNEQSHLSTGFLNMPT